MKYPGTEGRPFYIQFDNDYYRKRDILSTGSVQCIVTKVYRRTWWRRLLLWLGFRVRISQVKVLKKSEGGNNTTIKTT